MPKIRPARTAEEAALTPVSEPVTIELTDPPIQVAAESSAASVTAPPPVEQAPETEAPNPLQKQLDDLKAAEALSRAQAAEAQRQTAEAIRIANEHANTAARAEVAEEQALYNETVNAIAAAKADGDKAQTDYAVAMEAQDYAAAAEAQRRMSTASAYLARYEDNKAYLDQRRETLKTEQPRQQQQRTQPQLTVDQYIDTMHQLSPSQKNWLKSHPDAMTDPVKNNGLGWAHHKAVKAGIAIDTPEYFAALESELGYRSADAALEPAIERKGNSMPVSAPVQRSAPSPTGGAAAPTRVELTPEQREHARISGVDEVTYARGVLRLREAKASGHYGEQR